MATRLANIQTRIAAIGVEVAAFTNTTNEAHKKDLRAELKELLELESIMQGPTETVSRAVT